MSIIPLSYINAAAYFLIKAQGHVFTQRIFVHETKYYRFNNNNIDLNDHDDDSDDA